VGGFFLSPILQGEKSLLSIQGYKHSGEHRVLQDGSDAAGSSDSSGVYLYELRVGKARKCSWYDSNKKKVPRKQNILWKGDIMYSYSLRWYYRIILGFLLIFGTLIKAEDTLRFVGTMSGAAVDSVTSRAFAIPANVGDINDDGYPDWAIGDPDGEYVYL